MTTFRVGKSDLSLSAKLGIALPSPISKMADFIPAFAAVVSSSSSLRRPAMTTWFPPAWKASARARPMPEPPPVIRIVLPVICMIFSWLRSYDEHEPLGSRHSKAPYLPKGECHHEKRQCHSQPWGALGAAAEG